MHYPRRKKIRHPSHDYSKGGWYFITLFTRLGVHHFGKIHSEKMHLSPIGVIAEKFWIEILQHAPHVKLDTFVVMPNHLHGILKMQAPEGFQKGITFRSNSFGPQPKGSLQVILGQYKAAVTRYARKNGCLIFDWLPRFDDRIVRSEKDLPRIRRYIRNNPQKWWEKYGASPQ
ncbi:MAG: transposase [Marinifilaceae bacterium]